MRAPRSGSKSPSVARAAEMAIAITDAISSLIGIPRRDPARAFSSDSSLLGSNRLKRLSHASSVRRAALTASAASGGATMTPSTPIDRK